jgi:cytochrome c biogenesis protein CcmG, thiol:disulfide interchange protein DsbE
MKSTIRLVLLLILLSLIGVWCTRRPSPRVAAVGQEAPPFRLADLKGREVSLSQYKGKVVILDFWATWCGPCRLSMPLLEKLQANNPDEFVLLAINLEESPEEVRAYVEKEGIKATVLLDTEGTLARDYSVESIPMQVIIDKKGTVRQVLLGFNPNMTEQLKGEIDKLSVD